MRQHLIPLPYCTSSSPWFMITQSLPGTLSPKSMILNIASNCKQRCRRITTGQITTFRWWIGMLTIRPYEGYHGLIESPSWNSATNFGTLIIKTWSIMDNQNYAPYALKCQKQRPISTNANIQRPPLIAKKHWSPCQLLSKGVLPSSY